MRWRGRRRERKTEEHQTYAEAAATRRYGGYQGGGSKQEARPPQKRPSAAHRPPEAAEVATVRVEVADAHHSPHSSPTPCCWVPVFVDWAEGRIERLDFQGREIPKRVQTLLEAAFGPPGR